MGSHPGKDRKMLSTFGLSLRNYMNNSYELSEHEELRRYFLVCPFIGEYIVEHGNRPW